MLSFFPKQIVYRAIIVYLISLFAVSFVYVTYSMQWVFIALGCVFVVGFFLLTSQWSKDVSHTTDSSFVGFLFGIALLIRVLWVVGSNYYYIAYTGSSFGYEIGDAVGYHDRQLFNEFFLFRIVAAMRFDGIILFVNVDHRVYFFDHIFLLPVYIVFMISLLRNFRSRKRSRFRFFRNGR